MWISLASQNACKYVLSIHITTFVKHMLILPSLRLFTIWKTCPNIIIIYGDDHAQHAISAYGSKINRTPHIDQLAAQGMRFNNSFVGNSICGPARATILTGLHSHANGKINNRKGFKNHLATYPKILKKLGYQNIVVGKWHIKSDPMGFDYWDIVGNGAYYNMSPSINPCFYKNTLIDGLEWCVFGEQLRFIEGLI